MGSVTLGDQLRKGDTMRLDAPFATWCCLHGSVEVFELCIEEVQCWSWQELECCLQCMALLLSHSVVCVEGLLCWSTQELEC